MCTWYGRIGRCAAVLIMAVCSAAVTGCGTLPDGRGWGQDAIYPLNLGRIPEAAYHALVDPQTLAPLAGAAAVAPFDRKVSDWARDHTPIFGSHEAAEKVDTTVLPLLRWEWIGTALVTPSGDNPEDWIYAKLKGIGVEWGSEEATREHNRLPEEGDRSHPTQRRGHPEHALECRYGRLQLYNARQ